MAHGRRAAAAARQHATIGGMRGAAPAFFSRSIRARSDEACHVLLLGKARPLEPNRVRHRRDSTHAGSYWHGAGPAAAPQPACCTIRPELSWHDERSWCAGPPRAQQQTAPPLSQRQLCSLTLCLVPSQHHGEIPTRCWAYHAAAPSRSSRRRSTGEPGAATQTLCLRRPDQRLRCDRPRKALSVPYHNSASGERPSGHVQYRLSLAVLSGALRFCTAASLQGAQRRVCPPERPRRAPTSLVQRLPRPPCAAGARALQHVLRVHGRPVRRA